MMAFDLYREASTKNEQPDKLGLDVPALPNSIDHSNTFSITFSMSDSNLRQQYLSLKAN